MPDTRRRAFPSCPIPTKRLTPKEDHSTVITHSIHHVRYQPLDSQRNPTRSKVNQSVIHSLATPYPSPSCPIIIFHLSPFLLTSVNPIPVPWPLCFRPNSLTSISRFKSSRFQLCRRVRFGCQLSVGLAISSPCDVRRPSARWIGAGLASWASEEDEEDAAWSRALWDWVMEEEVDDILWR